MGKDQSKSARQREALGDHDGPINGLALSEDGSLLVTISDDKTARLWPVKTPETECIGILKGHSNYLTAVAVCETFVVTGSADGSIRKWDMGNCDCVFVYEGHKSRIQRLLVTGEFIFSSSHDKTARMWLFDTDKVPPDHPERACIRVFQGHTLAVFPLIFIPGRLPVVSGGDLPMGGGGLPTSEEVAMLPDLIQPGDCLVTGSADCTARTWAVDTGATLRVFRGHSQGVVCMAASRDGKDLYTGSADNTIRIWNMQSGECTKVMEGHDNPVLSMVMVSRLLYSGSSDGTARCWVPEFGECIRVYRGHQHGVACLKFHDGILYTGSGDTCARAFDGKSGALLRVYKGHSGAVSCITVAAGKVFTGSTDNTLRVWDATAPGDEVDVPLDDEEEEEEEAEEKIYQRQQQKRLDEVNQRLDKFIIDDDGEGQNSL